MKEPMQVAINPENMKKFLKDRATGEIKKDTDFFRQLQKDVDLANAEDVIERKDSALAVEAEIKKRSEDHVRMLETIIKTQEMYIDSMTMFAEFAARLEYLADAVVQQEKQFNIVKEIRNEISMLRSEVVENFALLTPSLANSKET